MSVYMRAVLTSWHDPSFEALRNHLTNGGPLKASAESDWPDFELRNEEEVTVLTGDLWLAADAQEEAQELLDELPALKGSDEARASVEKQLEATQAIVGMQISMSDYDESVAGANAVIEFLEQAPNVLTQIDTVGWYDGSGDLLLSEDS